MHPEHCLPAVSKDPLIQWSCRQTTLPHHFQVPVVFRHWAVWARLYLSAHYSQTVSYYLNSLNHPVHQIPGYLYSLPDCSYLLAHPVSHSCQMAYPRFLPVSPYPCRMSRLHHPRTSVPFLPAQRSLLLPAHHSRSSAALRAPSPTRLTISTPKKYNPGNIVSIPSRTSAVPALHPFRSSSSILPPAVSALAVLSCFALPEKLSLRRRPSTLSVSGRSLLPAYAPNFHR